MLVVALAFGMTVVGCDDPEDPDNPFKGEWNGTFDGESATISFTDSTWTLTYGDVTPLTGRYTPGIKKVNLKAKEGSGILGISTYSKVGISVTIYKDDDTEITGIFTRIKTALTEPFKGNWSGTYKPTGGTEVEATFTFTDDVWTLSFGTGGGAKTATGKYTKSAIGLTATLKVSTFTVGSAVLTNPNPTSRKLRVDIIQSNVDGTNGSGTFEPAATP
jgi:opacity protein-like surface antigen